jgi:hypothetical protein
MDTHIPGVTPTFHYNARQLAWNDAVDSCPNGAAATVLVARRRDGRSTWLATRVLSALAEVAPLRREIDVWVADPTMIERFALMLILLADPGMLDTTVTSISLGRIEFGPQHSVVNVRCWASPACLATAASLIVFDNIDYAPLANGPDAFAFVGYDPTRFIATSSSPSPHAANILDLTQLVDALPDSTADGDSAPHPLFKVRHFTDGWYATQAFCGTLAHNVALAHTG